MVGEILNGRYEILKSVGFGGMAEVYLAKDVLLDRKIAVKVLRKKFLDNKAQLEQFKREARSAARLIHPSIVTIYDVCDQGDISYILMEYVEGVSLKTFEEQNGRMDPGLAVALAAQLASALDHAHNHNIIHCDIKPQNIVLTQSMVPKIVDFGISRIVSSETMAFTASVVGSVHYFSPEQAQGLAVTAQSDIYSLGIVFYEMLTGRVPFDGDNAVLVARKQVEEQAPPLKAFWPEAPEALQRIIDKALAKDVADRYATAEDMRNDLLEVKNQIYPSKNTEPFLDATIPLKAVNTVSPIKAAMNGATVKVQDLKTEPDHDKYQTLIMSLPRFLTREINDEEEQKTGVAKPENTKKIESVISEENPSIASDTGSAAEGSAVAVAAGSYGEAEQQSLFTDDPGAADDGNPDTKAITSGERGKSRTEMKTGTQADSPETKKEPEVKPLVIAATVDRNRDGQPAEGGNEAEPADPSPVISGTGNQKKVVSPAVPGKENREKKSRKKSGILSAILKILLVLILLLAGGIYYFFGSSKPDIVVQDVNGKTVTEARKVLEGQGFKVEVEDKVDPSVAPGVVLRTDPVAGIKRKEGATITLVVSGTEKLTEVPKIVGLKQEQAEKILSDNNLRIERIEYKWDKTKPEGEILSQTPEEKSKVGDNGGVNIIINKREEKTVEIPDLKGMSLAEAKSRLAALKLNVEVREKDSDKDKDTILDMSPGNGSTLTEGGTVVLLVSNEKKKLSFPSTPENIERPPEKSSGSVSISPSTGAKYVEFVVPGTGSHMVQIVSNTGTAQKIEVSGSYNGGVRLRTKVGSDVRRVGFYVDHRLVEEKSW